MYLHCLRAIPHQIGHGMENAVIFSYHVPQYDLEDLVWLPGECNLNIFILPIVMPPPPLGAGGIMFLGSPSVCMSVCPSVHPFVLPKPCEHDI